MTAAILPRDDRLTALARAFARRRDLLRSFAPTTIAEALRLAVAGRRK